MSCRINAGKVTTGIRAAAAVLFSAVCLAGCSKVDDRLGLGLVPDDQRAVVLTDTIAVATEGYQTIPDSMRMQIYQTMPDSISSQNQGFILSGVLQSPETGLTATSGVMQFLPAVTDKTYTYGFRPVIDKVVLTLQVYDVQGDTTIGRQKEFYIYEVQGGTISSDSDKYFTFFDPTTVIRPDPLFSFKFSGVANNIFKVRLDKDAPDSSHVFPAGTDFLNRIIADTIRTGTSDASTLFHKKFGGFYIAPAPGTDPASGAIIYMRVDPTTSYNTYFTVYSRNFDQTTLAPKDTLTTEYWFDSSYNTSIISVRHDYTGTPIQTALDNGTTAPLATVYSHSPAGATPMIRFTDQFTARMKALMTYKGEQYGSLAVNRAEIRIPITTPGDIPFLNRSPQRLGMYYNYNTYTPIPDFAYAYESQGGTIPFGGYLQRARGFYSMDITSYLQNLATKPSTTRRDVYLGMPPIYQLISTGYYYFFDPVFSNVYTAIDATKIEVIMTYTLIK